MSPVAALAMSAASFFAAGAALGDVVALLVWPETPSVVTATLLGALLASFGGWRIHAREGRGADRPPMDADAGLALQVERSAVHFDERLAQRQAEPGAFELAGERAFDLPERRQCLGDMRCSSMSRASWIASSTIVCSVACCSSAKLRTL